MKINILLSHLNDSGAITQIESEDGLDSVELFRIESNADAVDMCRRTAAFLRNLAVRFDYLANQKEPFKVSTQEYVNMEEDSK